MTKKRYLFMILAAAILLTSVLAAGCTDPSSGGGSGTNTVSFLSLQILPQTNGFNGDTENPVCLDISNGTVELFDIRVRLTNPSDYEIISLRYNGTTFTSDRFGSESTNSDIYIMNAVAPADEAEYTVTITDIYYRVGSETRRLESMTGNSAVVRIDPDFELTLDFSEADVGADTGVYTVNYRSAIPFPANNDMNADDGYGYQDKIFVGWFTEPEGGDEVLYGANYLYYKDVTLYARYATAFNYSSDGESVTVTGLTEEGRATSFDIVIPSEMEGLPVTSIAPRAFATVGAGKTFVLADSVKTIGDYAFYNATGVRVIMPGVTDIGYAAFMNAGRMYLGYPGYYQELPLSLERIGAYAFANSGFDTRFMPAGATAATTFSMSLFIPATVNYIGANAFSGSLFEAVYIPSGSALSTGELPAEDADGYDFTDFNIGEGIFRDSSALETVITGYTLSSRGSVQIAASGGLEVISDYMFYNCRALVTGSGTTGLRLVPGLRHIGANAFSSANSSGSEHGMTSLNSVTIPSTVEYIGDSAFANAALYTVTFDPASALRTLGAWAFQETNITEITFYSLTEYGAAPFWGSTTIRYVNILTDNVPTFVKPTSDTTGLRIKYFVQYSSLARFRAATGWSDISERILSYDHRVMAGSDGGYVFEPVDENGSLTTDTAARYAKITYLYSTESEVIVPRTVSTDGSAFYTATDIGTYVTDDAWTDSLSDNIIEVRIPDSVVRIAESAFYNVSKLMNVAWSYVGESGAETEYSSGDVSGLKLKYIGNYAFQNTSLVYFKSPATLEYIGGEAFMNSALETADLTLGANIQIGTSAFSNNKISFLTIGSAGSIGGYAFANQTGSAMTVRFLISTPPERSAFDPFLNCTVSVAYVPDSIALGNFSSSGFSTTLNGKYEVGA